MDNIKTSHGVMDRFWLASPIRIMAEGRIGGFMSDTFAEKCIKCLGLSLLWSGVENKFLLANNEDALTINIES